MLNTVPNFNGKAQKNCYVESTTYEECSIVVKNNTLEFYFQNLGSADVQNFRKLKKGDLLFSLSKTGNGKSTKYLFQPAVYKIVRIDQSKQKTPVYFEKPQV